MRYIFLLLTTMVFSFCNNETNRKETADTSQVTNEKKLDNDEGPSDEIDGCYLMILKRDTMVLHLQNNMNTLYGKLTYDNFEKDGSSGIVEGTQEGDILKLHYSFASEGMNSVMDVYFKADGDRLIRGAGDMKMRGDTTFFTNPAAIDYTDKNHFKRTDCAAIPAKYRL